MFIGGIIIKSFNIVLDSIDKVKEFVNDMSDIEGEVIIYCDWHFSNAKSILGVLSLDLSKTLRLQVSNWKEEYSVLVDKYLAI